MKLLSGENRHRPVMGITSTPKTDDKNLMSALFLGLACLSEKRQIHTGRYSAAKIETRNESDRRTK
jgi:hypothetical protein